MNIKSARQLALDTLENLPESTPMVRNHIGIAKGMGWNLVALGLRSGKRGIGQRGKRGELADLTKSSTWSLHPY